MEDIYDLFQKVKSHPDFVFGTIFTRGDFENPDNIPDEAYDLQDRLVEMGNELIAANIEEDW